MNKKIRAGALALALAAALSAASLVTVQAVRGIPETTVAVAAQAAVLKQGSRGEDVKTVQRKLRRWGYYEGSVDGIFGPATKKAVIWFQRKNGLTADGIVGAKTYAALGMMQQAGNTSSGSTGGYTDSDTYLLARCIYAEARGGELYRAGRRRSGRPQPRKERSVPQYHFGRHLSAPRLYGGFRRADQSRARSDGDQRREGRDERLGSDVRLSLIHISEPTRP